MTKVVSVQLGHFIFSTFDSKLLRIQLTLVLNQPGCYNDGCGVLAQFQPSLWVPNRILG